MKGKKTGGRKKGTRNKLNQASLDLKAAAQAYTEEALDTLASIMKTGVSEGARISAAQALLDRGYGRPPQALTNAEGGPLIPGKVVHEHITG